MLRRLFRSLSGLPEIVNRLMLTRAFWRSTRTTSYIAEARVEFDYHDGQSSPHAKRLVGYWGPLSSSNKAGAN